MSIFNTTYIEVTTLDGKKIFINTKYIQSILIHVTDGNSTIVQMTGDADEYYLCIETPNEVIEKIRSVATSDNIEYHLERIADAFQGFANYGMPIHQTKS